MDYYILLEEKKTNQKQNPKLITFKENSDWDEQLCNGFYEVMTKFKYFWIQRSF